METALYILAVAVGLLFAGAILVFMGGMLLAFINTLRTSGGNDPTSSPDDQMNSDANAGTTNWHGTA
jgi:hypothetical protein